MTDLDLTEAVDAAARRWLAEASDGSWDKAAPIAKNRIREAVLSLVEAAAPVIADQVAEQIAGAIEGYQPRSHDASGDALALAAGIAREVGGSNRG